MLVCGMSSLLELLTRKSADLSPPVIAPTGAGKTDVAIMAILRVVIQNLRPNATVPYGKDSIERSAFKVIYVAPMKALAAEITRKFQKRLAWLGILVRELTGDMQLTRKEINETQIIVTTPEKWDVVTRKPTGEGELVSVSLESCEHSSLSAHRYYSGPAESSPSHHRRGSSPERRQRIRHRNHRGENSATGETLFALSE